MKRARFPNLRTCLTVDEIKARAETTKPGTSIWIGCLDLEPPVEVICLETGKTLKVRRIGVEGFHCGRVMLVGTNLWEQAWDFKLPKKGKAQLTKV